MVTTAITWIGHADVLLAINAGERCSRIVADEASHLRRGLTDPSQDRRDDGRLAPFVRHCGDDLSRLFVLCDYEDQAIRTAISEWLEADLGLRGRCTLVPVNAANPNDYAAAYIAAERLVRTLPAGTRLAYYAAPGTSAMRVALMFLAKTRSPGVLYHLPAGQEQPEVLDLPFDLEADFLPYLAEQRRLAAASVGLAGVGEIPECAISGASPAIVEARALAYHHAQWDFDVLIHGESGTGKDVLARFIHKNSSRFRASEHDGFYAINCAEISPNLLASELFGHTRGAFTDASSNKTGIFERANKGTLFLDEVGECSLELQAALLRVLQPIDDRRPTIRRVRYVGGEKEVDVDVRLIAATNRNLRDMVDEGTFRLDLYQRISSLVIRLPSLAERRDDIPMLADEMLGNLNAAVGRINAADHPKSLTVAAKRALQNAAWPGNARGMQNILRRAFVFSRQDAIDESDILRALSHDPFASPTRAPILERAFGDRFSLDELKSELYSHYIDRALRDAEGNVSRASRLLGYADEGRLRKQLSRLGIEAEKYKPKREPLDGL